MVYIESQNNNRISIYLYIVSRLTFGIYVYNTRITRLKIYINTYYLNHIINAIFTDHNLCGFIKNMS